MQTEKIIDTNTKTIFNVVIVPPNSLQNKLYDVVGVPINKPLFCIDMLIFNNELIDEEFMDSILHDITDNNYGFKSRISGIGLYGSNNSQPGFSIESEGLMKLQDKIISKFMNVLPISKYLSDVKNNYSPHIPFNTLAFTNPNIDDLIGVTFETDKFFTLCKDGNEYRAENSYYQLKKINS